MSDIDVIFESLPEGGGAVGRLPIFIPAPVYETLLDDDDEVLTTDDDIELTM